MSESKKDSIAFNIPCLMGDELSILQHVISQQHFSGDGPYSKICHEKLRQMHHSQAALLTTSCTHALEMTALLLNIQAGDEVILPSFTFVSTASAFALRGAQLRFVDIRPETLNIDENEIEKAISPRTKAIVVVHYAGVACDMQRILGLARTRNIAVVEDAAQALGARYQNKPLGGLGDFGCLSFHETKNLQCGEGGALLIRDAQWIEKAEIIREKGTNRSQFFRGQVDKYTWVELGSSYLPSEWNAGFLASQLEHLQKVNQRRLELWRHYHQGLETLARRGLIERPHIPESCTHNAHLYYIKVKNLDTRQKLMLSLREQGIHTAFHYVPLHSSPMGKKWGEFVGKDIHTTAISERLLRLPLYYALKNADADRVLRAVKAFYGPAY